MIKNLAEVAKDQRQAGERAARAAAEAEKAQAFYADQRKLIGDLPEALYSFVAELAWEYGHHAGYHEVLIYAQDIGDRLRAALKAQAILDQLKKD